MARLAAPRTTLAIAWLSLLLASSAGAHEPEREGGRDGEGPAAQNGRGEDAHPSVPGDELYEGWSDPYADERRWRVQAGAGGGYFAPWQGDGGGQGRFEVLASSPSGHFRVGGEFVYREFETRLFDVSDVDVDAYHFDVVFHYVPTPGGFSPYVGGGLGLQVNDVDQREVTSGNPAIVVRDDVGLGFGVFAVLGLEVPLGERFALFAEGRASLALQAVGRDDDGFGYADYDENGVDDVDIEDMGGASGTAGLRFRF